MNNITFNIDKTVIQAKTRTIKATWTYEPYEYYSDTFVEKFRTRSDLTRLIKERKTN